MAILAMVIDGSAESVVRIEIAEAGAEIDGDAAGCRFVGNTGT
jgi:hypothetical protein